MLDSLVVARAWDKSHRNRGCIVLVVVLVEYGVAGGTRLVLGSTLDHSWASPYNLNGDFSMILTIKYIQ